MSDMEQIKARLDEGERRFAALEQGLKANTELTQQIANSLQPLASLFGDLEAGTRIMCRMARGVSWVLKDVIEPFWKPSLVVFVSVYWIVNDHRLPQWISFLVK